MHYLDANKTAGEEARRQLHKNAASNVEQVLAATPHKTTTIIHLPPITKTIQVSLTRHAGEAGTSSYVMYSYRPPHMAEQKQDGQLEHTYIQLLREDTGCSPEDLPEAMNDIEKWRERVSDICAGGMT